MNHSLVASLKRSRTPTPPAYCLGSTGTSVLIGDCSSRCRCRLASRLMPDRLHFTGNDEADTLLAQEPMALLIGFALDQQVPVPTAFTGPLKLKQRIGTLDAGRIAATDPGELEAAFREKPAIHRFPGTMAARVQELAAFVTEHYGGRAERALTEAAARGDPQGRSYER